MADECLLHRVNDVPVVNALVDYTTSAHKAFSVYSVPKRARSAGQNGQEMTLLEKRQSQLQKNISKASEEVGLWEAE